MNIFERLPQGRHPLIRLSRGLAYLEIGFGGLLVLLMLGLMLYNMVARGFGAPQVWTDELAVACMVWLAFIGASVAIPTKTHMVMGLLPETLAPRKAAILALLCNLVVLLYLLVMAVIIWNWLDLPGLIAAGSVAEFSSKTFNFIYSDPTLTLGMRKIWFWLILPISAVTSILHLGGALVEDMSRLQGAKS